MAVLRLTPAFSELDAHQKTILCEDFGMGAPVYWLPGRLQIGAIVDGRYDRVAASIGATAVKPPNEDRENRPTSSFPISIASGAFSDARAPRPAARPVHGKWRMLARRRPEPWLRNVLSFFVGHIGQRLASGLMIGLAGGRQASGLRIIDPPGADKVMIPPTQLSLGDDPAGGRAGQSHAGKGGTS
ncbi:hypothetical protein [Methylocapsa sp. S129]|uniref:hypothetical protein n=1 Tax=Methylocapsa sp. S129 TaxID=1641869 RepID=UPI00131D7ED3|nr:hypothetical protein [Methylocapsa sp. S129]